jgi:uncharacterized protein (DUF924 family)
MDQILANLAKCSSIVAGGRAAHSSSMAHYLLIALPCCALLIWIFRPRPLQRPSSPGLGDGYEPGFLLPPEDFSAFLWLAALPPRLDVEPRAPAAAVAQRASEADRESAAADVIEFWRAAGPTRWFAKDPGFDRRFRERFLALHEAANRGELLDWTATSEGALALLLLLDQFPRNAFRGTPRMYASDGLARCMAERALALGHDRAIEPELRLFVYLPFGHSERLCDQERSLELNRSLDAQSLRNAQRHHDIVKRFGRFPHRNPILERAMRADEQAFLDSGGYAG